MQFPDPSPTISLNKENKLNSQAYNNPQLDDGVKSINQSINQSTKKVIVFHRL